MANYYVSADGSDSNPGTATLPWRTANKVRSFSFSTSDCVYFRCGDTFYPSGIISAWGGTSGSPNVIGAYYMDGGSVVHGVDGNRPIISGNNYQVPENKLHGDRESYRGLIHVRSKDYVHIKNLHILESGYYGIRVVGNLDAGTNSAHFLIKNVKTEGSYSDGIQSVYNANNYGFIEDCEVLGAQYGWHVGARSGWGGGIGTVSSPYSNITIRRNYIHHSWGEGILTIRPGQSGFNGGYATIEDNIVWNNRRVDIYIDRTEGNILRRNLLLGAGAGVVGSYSSTSRDGRGWNQFGIWINLEQRAGDMLSISNNSVYNNLISGHYAGMGISSEYDEGIIENVFFYNNTLIGNRVNITVGSRLSGYTMTNVEFKNNISYCPQDTISQDTGTQQSWWASKIAWYNNAWTTAPTHASGANDIVFDGNLAKTTGWQDLVAPISANNFKLLEGSNARNAGMDLST